MVSGKGEGGGLIEMASGERKILGNERGKEDMKRDIDQEKGEERKRKRGKGERVTGNRG